MLSHLLVDLDGGTIRMTVGIINAGTAPLSGKDDIRNSFLMGFDFDF